MKVAVIGGGPVGLATSLYLEREGHEVHLFERGAWPVDKACGQGLMPSGMDKLQDLGVSIRARDECQPFVGISYFDDHYSIDGLLPRSGFGIERTVLSQKLYDRVREIKDIHIFANSPVLNSQQRPDGFFIHAGEGLQRFDYAFACDGLHSPLRSKYHNQFTRSRPWRMGAREHFHQKPWSNKVEVYWNQRAEAYVTPVGKNKVEVAFLWYENLPLGKADLRNSLWKMFPVLRGKIDMAQAAGDFRGHGPFSKRALKIRKDRLFFLGDAYCFLDAITGEGLSLGFKASQLIAKNFQDWNIFSELQVKRLYWHYGVMVSMALFLSRNTCWRKKAFRLLGRYRGSFDLLLSLNDV